MNEEKKETWTNKPHWKHRGHPQHAAGMGPTSQRAESAPKKPSLSCHSALSPLSSQIQPSGIVFLHTFSTVFVSDGEPHLVTRVLHMDTSAALISHISIAHTQINSPIAFYWISSTLAD